MQYRKLTTQDYEVYHALRDFSLDAVPEAFGSTNEEETPHRKERFDANVQHKNNFILGAFAGDSLVGYVGFMKSERIKTGHKGTIWGTFVHPTVQRRGIGSILMKNALERATQIDGLQQVKLDVNAENPAAIHLYEKMGFVAYGREKNALLVNGKMYEVVMMSLIFNE